MSRTALTPEPPDQFDPRARADIPRRIEDGEYGDGTELSEEDWANLAPIDLGTLQRDDER